MGLYLKDKYIDLFSNTIESMQKCAISQLINYCDVSIVTETI